MSPSVRDNVKIPLTARVTACCPVMRQSDGQLAGNVPVGRLSKPEEVTKAVVSLVESPFVTAQTLSVDGEMHPR
jgi:NAD(P)-dependent dehydrogenase (short-subunit alcohol dehydrogenase family)